MLDIPSYAAGDAGSRTATGDEIARALNWEQFRVRHRASELGRDGRIVESGARRDSFSGIASIVWLTPGKLGGVLP